MVIYIALVIKIKNNNKLFIVAAERPKMLHATSSQFITALDIICSLRLDVFVEILSPPEQLDGPARILFSIPTCQSE